MILPRALEKPILTKLQTSSKAVIIYGPRQVGKTTLVKHLMKNTHYKSLLINADEQRYIDILSSRDKLKLHSLVAGYQLVCIDEAQRVPDIGINLKILIDEFPRLKIIATGSSSFDLASKVSEPLTGRTWTYTLYPLSFFELQTLHNGFELTSQLEERLIFGSYPEIFTVQGEEKYQYIRELARSYLYKDVLELAAIKHSAKIYALLKLIAFQIGHEVSLNELGAAVGMSKDTVSKYIDLLEKSFVLFRLKGFSRNLRKEVTKMDKIYFYDLGVRNIVIDNLKGLADRDDHGQLWENFLVAERMKLLSYTQTLSSSYFWRTHTGAELDYIEERGGRLYGYEFKWTYSKKTQGVHSWLKTYPDAKVQYIARDSFLPFVCTPE